MEKLFNISNMLDRNIPTYIVGTGRMALLQFTALLQEHIAISGFITEEGVKPEYQIMGKDIFLLKEVPNKNICNLIVATQNFEKTVSMLEKQGYSKNVFVDIHMYSNINDCVWTYM